MLKTKITIFPTLPIGQINPNIYGHFVEHLGGVVYDGVWVGEDSSIPNIRGFRKELVEKLKAINPPVMRWPGGCFAETYDWRDGIGPREQRPTTVNWWYMNDGLYESNHVGTHEFVDFCRMVDSEPYFALNATTTHPLEGRNWIEYCNMPADSTSLAKLREDNGSREPLNIKYWGLGNENWGGGGAMTPEDYCRVYRTHGIICKSVYPDGYYIACGANDSIPDWTEKFFSRYNEMYTEGRIPPLKGYSLHYYVANNGNLGEETTYTDEQWYEALRIAWGIEPFIQTQIDMINAAIPDNDIDLIVDEWGLWHLYHGRDALPNKHLFSQESTMREAVLAAISLNVFNNYCHRVKMSNIAQLVNCIHSLFLARGEKFVTTTTYHVYDMFKEHQGAQAVKSVVDTPEVNYTMDGKSHSLATVSCSSSIHNGMLYVTLANLSIDSAQKITIDLLGAQPNNTAVLTILAGESDKDGNSFDNPDKVLPQSSEISISGDCITITIPKASVAKLTCPLKNFDAEMFYKATDSTSDDQQMITG